MYGSETWPLKEEQRRRLETNKMRMQRMMCGVTLKDKISNVEIRSKVHVGLIGEVIARGRLRWFGHVVRSDNMSLIKQALDARPDQRRRCRLRLRWEELVTRDMKSRELRKEDAMERDVLESRREPLQAGINSIRTCCVLCCETCFY